MCALHFHQETRGWLSLTHTFEQSNVKSVILSFVSYQRLFFLRWCKVCSSCQPVRLPWGPGGPGSPGMPGNPSLPGGPGGPWNCAAKMPAGVFCSTEELDSRSAEEEEFTFTFTTWTKAEEIKATLCSFSYIFRTVSKLFLQFTDL